MKNVQSWITAALALAGLGSACASDDKVDLGDNEEPRVLGASLSDYEGTWVGYAELATWDDGTDTVRLILDANGNGVIEVGEGAPLPPPVVDETYPPGLGPDLSQGFVEPLFFGVISGFSYPVEGAMVESKRIRMSSASAELYSEYCALQTPMLVQGQAPGDYNCIGSSGYVYTPEEGCVLGDGMTPIDCDRLACVQLCLCDETSCTPRGAGPDIRMDAALESEGEELEGSLETPQGSYQLRMMRE